VREKEELRNLIQTGRQRERTDLQPYVNDIPPHQAGQWTAKDQLAHVIAWRRVAAAELEAVRTGVPDPGVADGDYVENARIYEETHRLPAATVIEAAERSWDQLSSALEACSEDVLSKPRIRDRGAEAWLWQVVPDSSPAARARNMAWGVLEADLQRPRKHRLGASRCQRPAHQSCPWAHSRGPEAALRDALLSKGCSPWASRSPSERSGR
jgi:hypothetical protein